jgi:hypothetical protein
MPKVPAAPRLIDDGVTTADDGTVNVALNAPVALAVTVAGVVVTVAPLNLIVTACDGTALVPVTVTVWPGTPVDVDNVIAACVTVNVALVVSFAKNVAIRGDPKNGTLNVVLVIVPVADDLTGDAGTVTRDVPLSVNVK